MRTAKRPFVRQTRIRLEAALVSSAVERYGKLDIIFTTRHSCSLDRTAQRGLRQVSGHLRASLSGASTLCHLLETGRG